MPTAPNERTYSFDAGLLLSDGVTAITADGYAQNAGADGVIDLGGRQTVTPTQQARADLMMVIDVTAIDIASGDETYTLLIVGSNDSSFGTGNVQVLSGTKLGKGTSIMTGGKDSVVGRYEVPFSTEQAAVKYQYLKLFVDVGGTTPSITFKAFAAPMQFD